MSSYDSAITVFSPGGNLMQVEYAMEAVKKGLCAVGIRGRDSLVLGVEKKIVTKLQETRTIRKILPIDDHICMIFSGLNADARIISLLARVECQSYRLNYDVDPPVDYIARYISSIQTKYTQKGGVRPFGISNLITGFDSEGKPRLYQTEPSGACTEWRANAIGRNSKQVREFLEKNITIEPTEQEALKLVTKALLEIVESANKNIELVVLRKGQFKYISEEEVTQLVKTIEDENSK